ncbi:MAG: tetratricopeptide (TPR) repeat protein, partial [Planctomycetota bacterium]
RARRPLEAGLHLSSGDLLLRLRRPEAALDAYRECLRLAPNLRDALRRYCHELELCGGSVEAALTSLISVPGAWRARIELSARVLARSLEASDRARCLQLCREALTEVPESDEAIRLCAELWHQHEAWEELAQLLAPGGPGAGSKEAGGVLLAHALIELGRLPEARALLKSHEGADHRNRDALVASLEARLRLLETERGSVVSEPELEEITDPLEVLETLPEEPQEAVQHKRSDFEAFAAAPDKLNLVEEIDDPLGEEALALETEPDEQRETASEPVFDSELKPLASDAGTSQGVNAEEMAAFGELQAPAQPKRAAKRASTGRGRKRATPKTTEPDAERGPSSALSEPNVAPDSEAIEPGDEDSMHAHLAPLEAISLSSLALAQDEAHTQIPANGPNFQLLRGRGVPRGIAIEGPLWLDLEAVASQWTAPSGKPRLIAFPLAVEREDAGSVALARVLPVWMLQHWQIEGRVEGTSIFCTDNGGASVALRRLPTLMEMRRSAQGCQAADLMMRGRILRDPRDRDWVEMELWDAKLACLVTRTRVRLRTAPVRAARRLLERLSPKVGAPASNPPLFGLRPWPQFSEEDRLEWSALDTLIGLLLDLATSPDTTTSGSRTRSGRVMTQLRSLERFLWQRPERPLTHLIVGACVAAETHRQDTELGTHRTQLRTLVELMRRSRGRASRYGSTTAERRSLRRLMTALADSLDV